MMSNTLKWVDSEKVLDEDSFEETFESHAYCGNVKIASVSGLRFAGAIEFKTHWHIQLDHQALADIHLHFDLFGGYASNLDIAKNLVASKFFNLLSLMNLPAVPLLATVEDATKVVTAETPVPETKNTDLVFQVYDAIPPGDAWVEDDRTSFLYQVMILLALKAGMLDDINVTRALDIAAYGQTKDGQTNFDFLEI